jgi:anti-sigma B factor antagonist/stage II sporulation protein AA (anti-sigma F factor antagonist)
MSDLARIHFTRFEDHVISHVSGEIDLANAADIEAELAGGVPNDVRGLVVDISEVGYLDSAGVRLLFNLAGSLRRRGQRLALAIPPTAPVRRVLELSGVEQVVPVASTVEIAVAPVEERP